MTLFGGGGGATIPFKTMKEKTNVKIDIPRLNFLKLEIDKNKVQRQRLKKDVRYSNSEQCRQSIQIFIRMQNMTFQANL